ncbi:hypothetical protein NC653_039644 [Populus alba x Populus x berolinensis]|uniref:Uncharacterized protein n=1 Tax=Populus alba x Populus x berolinensis TaxID=444605 RepID=A0AAD6LEC0_9ROSI|nr:hypothetical protein NC653_039644 [Populus alba x Populus x berolinensis]
MTWIFLLKGQNKRINNCEATCKRIINGKDKKNLTSKNAKLEEICIGRMMVVELLNLHSSTLM